MDEKVAMLHLDKVGAKLTKMSDQADYISVKQSGPNQILIATKLVSNDYKIFRST